MFDTTQVETRGLRFPTKKCMKSLASTETEIGRATKRTFTQASTTNFGSNAVIMAIAESRSVTNEVGVAIIDQQANTCVTMQFADTRAFSRTIHQIILRQPSVV
jgi:DNA mismatch repair ATPase MutS